MNATLIVLTAFLFQSAVPESVPSAGLTSAVQAYWDHLLRREKSQALAFVAEGSRGHFLARTEPPFRSWRLESTEPLEEGGYQVSVVVDRFIQDGFYNWKVREEWIPSPDGWRVRIADQAAARRKIFEGNSAVLPQQGVLDFRPLAMRLHFFSPTQRGTLWVRNGLEQPVRITSLEYDQERFEVEEASQEIPAASVGKVVVRYRGQDSGKGLQSELLLKVEASQGQETLFRVPIRYNVISKAARFLLGLTPEAAQEIKKGDPVTARRVIPPGSW